jgi:hypothetical protein
MLIARETLNRSRFFIEKAAEVRFDDRQSFVYFLEASIVFARSVTFHLQKELKGYDGFNEWYSRQQKRLRECEVCKFFVNKRNYILKEGPVDISALHSVNFSATALASSRMCVKVIRGQPWYKRSPRIWWEDIRAPILSRIQQWQRQKKLKRQQRILERPKASAQSVIRFDDEPWNSRSATDVVAEYLDQLERVVSDAESRFVK